MYRRLVSTWVWAACAAFPMGALAQSNIALDRLEPAAAGSRLLTVSDPTVSGRARVFAGYVLSFAQTPLRVSAGGKSLGNQVDHQLVLHGLAAIDVAQRIRVALDVPLLLNQGGTSPTLGLQQFESPHGGSWGDLRVSGYYGALRQTKFTPAGAFGFSAWLPSGDERTFAGAGQLRWSVEALLGGDYSAWFWRVSVSRKHQSDGAAIATARSGWAAAAGIAYRLGALQIGPEVFGFAATDSPQGAFAARATNLESLLSARLWLGPLALSAAAGPGLTVGPGTPSYRVLFGLSFAAPDLCSTREASNETDERSFARVSNPFGSANRIARKPLIDTKLSTAASESSSRASAGANDEPDADGDQIDDARDACPNTRGITSEYPKLNGCPPAVTVQGEQLVLQQQVRFALGSDVILADSDEILTQLVRIIQQHPEIARIAVDGHTDNVGNEPANLALSRRRALSVVRWLIARGIDERRLEARGFGPRQPLVPNDTEAGRNQNRRVEFHIIGKTELGE